MIADGVAADTEDVGDFRVGLAEQHQVQYLPLRLGDMHQLRRPALPEFPFELRVCRMELTGDCLDEAQHVPINLGRPVGAGEAEPGDLAARAMDAQADAAT